MKNNRFKPVKYYLVLFFALFFLFFSGDLGAIDVQKTAIVMAVGIDKEEDGFVVTSQIAIPQDGKQGKSSQTVQLVSKGKTVSDALDEINAKTGWYPKLVFCRLIILGETAVEKNAFDCLEFFMLDEYLSDNCLIATCDGSAKELLNTSALVDPSPAIAMQKVLSPHAERVGSALPSTLREFAIGYFSDAQSGYLPVLTTKPQQEQATPTAQSGDSQSGQSGGQEQKQQEKPVYSANETALFKGGKRVGTLTKEETFAYASVKKKLRLAGYAVETENTAYSLSIKHNGKKNKLLLNADIPTLQISLTLTAGLSDISKTDDSTTDAGDIPQSVFHRAEQLLSSQITSAFNKCKACDCDLFGINENIQKYQSKHYEKLKKTALQKTVLKVKVRFEKVR